MKPGSDEGTGRPSRCRATRPNSTHHHDGSYSWLRVLKLSNLLSQEEEEEEQTTALFGVMMYVTYVFFLYIFGKYR